MPRVVLHLGMPRTGSTTLQHVWTRHRAALRELGILYPDLTPASAERPHLSHQHLGETMQGRRPRAELDELLARLGRDLRSGADTVILSHEMLAHRDPRSRPVARLLETLRRAGGTLEPLAVVKGAAEAANSAYTLRCQFLSERLDFAAYLRTPGLRFRLDLARRLLPWREACGGLVALPLRDCEDAAPLVERVWRAAGILDRAGHLLDAKDLARRANPSPGPVAIEASRRLAATGIRGRQGDEPMRRITRAIEAALRARGGEPEPFRGYDTELGAAIEAAWAPCYARFANAVWGRPWAERVAPPRQGPGNELLRTADPAGLALVDDVLAEVCPRLGVQVPPAGRPGLLAVLLRRLPL